MTKQHLHTQICSDEEENRQQVDDAILALKATIDRSEQLRKV